MTAGACVLCRAGTYQTGSGPFWKHTGRFHLVLNEVPWRICSASVRERQGGDANDPGIVTENVTDTHSAIVFDKRLSVNGFRFV